MKKERKNRKMNSKKSNLKVNLLFQVLYEVLLILLPFLTSPYLARRIGAEGLGTYGFSYSIAMYFVLFSMLGIKNYGNRAIARVADDSGKLNKTFSNILFVHIIVSLACLLIYIVYCALVKNEKLYAIIQIPFVLSGLLDISWFFFGIQKFKVTVVTSSVIRILNVLCIFIFVRNQNDLWKYCLIMSLGYFLSQLVLWLVLPKYIKFIKPSVKDAVIHLKPMLVLFIPVVAISLYKYMDKIMIGAFSTREELGFYENADKVYGIPGAIIGAFGTVMIPKMSSMAVKNEKASLGILTLSSELIMCLAFGMAGGMFGVGANFSKWFWGENFATSGTIIMMLAATIPFVSFANIIRTQFLIPQQKDKEYISSVVAGALVNIFLNLVLIPKYGAAGAAIGTIGAEIAVCLVQCCKVAKEIPLKRMATEAMIYMLPAVIMGFVIYYIGLYFNNGFRCVLIQICIGITLYSAIALTFLYIKKNSIMMNLINKIFKRR